MIVKPNRSLESIRTRKRKAAAGVAAGVLLVLLALGSLNILFSQDGPADEGLRTAMAPKADPSAAPDDGLWDGPVLYHAPAGREMHLILVEKAEQKLHLYRFDGRYRRVKSYFCATGEKQGKKRQEKDEKTPEGIYFNDRSYRDSKITVFGDRAFGLTYPDVFDRIEGNRGSGIFIHGSNRDVAPFSSNGCLVMENGDISDLDDRIDVERTPVIIGERLPYRFGAVKRDLAEIVPFLKKALLPEKYAGMPSRIDALTILGYSDRVVATASLRIGEREETMGRSRLFFADPGETLLVLLKREWSEKAAPTALAAALEGKPAEPQPAAKPAASAKAPVDPDATKDRERLASLVASWRRAWAGKDIDAYIARYHPAFSNKGRGLAEWKAYKQRLNQRNRSISVEVSGLHIALEGANAKAYFRQRYRSDTFRSNSYKVLEFRRTGGDWKIYREHSYARKPRGWMN